MIHHRPIYGNNDLFVFQAHCIQDPRAETDSVLQ
jgi:hypothetical protein